MKKLLSLLLCLAMLCGLLPVFAEDADPATLYPAAPIPVEEYIAYHKVTIQAADPSYTGALYVIQGHDGRYVMTDGLTTDGVPLLELRTEGRYVTGVTLSFPFYTEDVQYTSNMWSIWSIFAAMPFAMHDGLSMGEAYTRCAGDFDTLMGTSANDVCPICGMQAEISRETGVIRMHYTLHGEIPAAPAYETPALGLPGYTAFRAAVDARLTDMLTEAPAWTIPELLPEIGEDVYMVAVENLDDKPALVYKGDDLYVLMAAFTMEDEPHLTYTFAHSVSAETLFVPLLMAHGMSAEEAVNAYNAWDKTAGYRYGLLDALNGGTFTADFYGMKVLVVLTGAEDNPLLATYIQPYAREAQ